MRGADNTSFEGTRDFSSSREENGLEVGTREMRNLCTPLRGLVECGLWKKNQPGLKRANVEATPTRANWVGGGGGACFPALRYDI